MIRFLPVFNELMNFYPINPPLHMILGQNVNIIITFVRQNVF